MGVKRNEKNEVSVISFSKNQKEESLSQIAYHSSFFAGVQKGAEGTQGSLDHEDHRDDINHSHLNYSFE
jgi:hypothetical protein